MDAELSLHLWDESHLIIMYDPFNVFLKLSLLMLMLSLLIGSLKYSFVCVTSLSGFVIRVMLSL